jgi:hypothetical protein
MRDVTTIDWNKPLAKVRSLNPGTQKVFFTQDGIEYDAAGKACNPKQVKEHYAKFAAEAQKAADEAKDQAAAAQAQADEMLKQAGINKTAARKAAS